MARRRRGLGTFGDEFSQPRLRVNLAPLVDISLSLVIMFIVSVPFLIESGIFVSRGVTGKTQEVLRTKPEEKVTVNLYLRKDGTVLLNNEPVSIDDLPDLIQALMKRSATKTAVVSADSEAVYRDVIHLIDIAKLNGALDVAILKRARR